MYKDKDKEREAAKERMRRHRAQQKGVTSEGVTSEGVTLCTTFDDLPADVKQSIDRLSDTPEERQARTDRAIRYQRLFPGKQFKGVLRDATVEFLVDPQTILPVSKPGDPDYKPCGCIELCRHCGNPLPQLERPRQYPGACMACVLEVA